MAPARRRQAAAAPASQQAQQREGSSLAGPRVGSRLRVGLAALAALAVVLVAWNPFVPRVGAQLLGLDPSLPVSARGRPLALWIRQLGRIGQGSS